MSLAVVVGALLFALLTSAALADSSVRRFKTDGYASTYFGTCPADPVPVGTVCRDSFLEVFREGVAIDGGSVAPPKTPWSVYLFQATVTFEADGDVVESDVREGFLPVIDPATVTYDREHLAFASVRADIPMDDGTTASVNFDWRAISDRFVYGNDGPALQSFGFIHKFVDKCETVVNQGHQKLRVAAMTGTLNGAPVSSYTDFPAAYISFNHFVSIDVAHGGCG